MKKLFFIFILLCLGIRLAAQSNKYLYLHVEKYSEKQLLDSNNSNISIHIKAFKKRSLALGYVGLTLKDSVLKKQNWHYTFVAEKYFKKVILLSTQMSIEVPLKNTYQKINAQLVALENTGFPFAQINITQQEELGEQLTLHYEIDSGKLFTIHKIHIKSPDEFHEKTIYNMVGLKVGDLYNEKQIKNIPNVFSNTNLYELMRPPEVLFRPESVELFLVIKKRRASNADGYIGFQQDPENKSIVLNGNVNLTLKNALNRGEMIDFNWQSSPDKSQNFIAKIEYPYLLGLPISIGGNFNLQKQDTSFVRNSFYGSIKYLQTFYNIGLFAQLDQSFLLRNDNPLGLSEFNRTVYGLEATVNFLNASKYKSTFYGKIGTFNYESDSFKTASSTQNILYTIKYQQKINLIKYFYLKNNFEFQNIHANYALSKNEQYYFGGLNSVRGFYELELNGNTVFSALNALVFKPVELLSFELVYDYSQFHNDGFFQTNSVGFGFNLENASSTLSIVIANGTFVGSPFNFQNTKLHLGFVSNF
ncbi:hypothetical protein DNU06_08750 [Putridiphycobacter roseus]|uniref:Haemolysin activator HlyB C-terminal domain-containing protein n=1 Tax=Putridiphycobacter roseus TaxID=2219161 RepID=A0A2W1MYS4_9FLAO|nr:hypothetical protein [Putridiphycobacter roseus]PZE17349.1 hypothetical protein DNU06_08750 [Putridiphycobacter roseus]